MSPRLSVLIVLLAAACPVAAAAHGAAPAAGHAAPAPVVTEVMRKPLPDYPGKEALMLSVEYPPGGADPVHRHDAHAFVYVVEGAIVMGVAGGRQVELKAGESFYEAPGDLHTVGRNASGERPAKFVVVLLKDAGKPALMPVP